MIKLFLRKGPYGWSGGYHSLRGQESVRELITGADREMYLTKERKKRADT